MSLSREISAKIRKYRCKNVVKLLKVFPEITGEAVSNILNIPLFIHKHLCNDFKGSDIEKLLFHIRQLEEYSVQWKPNTAHCLETFWWLKQKLVARSEQSITLMSPEEDEKYYTPAEWAKVFFIFGGVKALLRFLSSHMLLPCTVAAKQGNNSTLQLKGIALEILHIICIENEEIVKHLSNCDGIIDCLFSLLQYTTTCIFAGKVIECLLLSRKNSLDLSKIQNLPELVSRLENIQLANFCKILAITLHEHKSSLFAQMKQKKSCNFYVRDVNQDVVLNIPNIMQRLVDVACAKPYIPYCHCIGSETDQWTRWIDEQVQMEIAHNHSMPFVSAILPLSTTMGMMGPETSIKMSTEFSFRADAACVIGLLLVGRHRRKVQKQLAELCLIPRLSVLFDHFVWRWNLDRLPRDFDSSPDAALKIQVLRLIHRFCDHSDYKHAMLSWSEYSELKQLEETNEGIEDNQIPTTTICLNQSQMCIGSQGLLTKIVEIMKRETDGSSLSCHFIPEVWTKVFNDRECLFWLSRVVESYLRGSATVADQEFLMRQGLLEHVIGLLVSYCSIRQKEVFLQNSFDLLGELVKFNHKAFLRLDKVLDTEVKRKNLLSLMNGSLVHSNMFIRSLILSQEHFLASGDKNVISYSQKQNFLLRHIADIMQRAKYLQKLISLITVDNLTQENVSCLNTAIVILMFAHKHGKLKLCFDMLNTYDDEDCPLGTVSSQTQIQNLFDLLSFWQEHYLQKDKDCTILEKSSHISFQEWKDIVEILMSKDTKSPSSLLHHLPPTSLLLQVY